MFAKDIKQLIDGIVRPPIIKGQEMVLSGAVLMTPLLSALRITS